MNGVHSPGLSPKSFDNSYGIWTALLLHLSLSIISPVVQTIKNNIINNVRLFGGAIIYTDNNA